MDSNLITLKSEHPTLYCLACEGQLVPRPHTKSDHAEPAWMCDPRNDCILSGVCLSCQRLLAWFQAQNEALGGD
jgi:hypothetical protein